MTLFNSRTAGKFIVTLAWMCPFLYTNSALLSVINGLGKTGSTFLINAAGLALRIGSVFMGSRDSVSAAIYGVCFSASLPSLCLPCSSYPLPFHIAKQNK